MMAIVMFILSFCSTASLLAWLYILLHPARPWDMQPVNDDACIPEHKQFSSWPRVDIIVPARNEAEALAKSLPALLAQEYPGVYHVILVDDRSTDDTAETARQIAVRLRMSERLTVLQGKPLPEGWVGKVWALEQGAKAAVAAGSTGFILLTDADILHTPMSLRRLVSESMSGRLGLNSRMARLNCCSPSERLLIPAFVFFFNLLYPMRRVNDPKDKTAAAAGGCVLLSSEALQRMGGGFEPIKGEIIDDVNLARVVKALGFPIRLGLSRKEVQSLREYPRLQDIWKMVRRTAFTELKYSWFRLLGALFALVLLFVVPILSIVVGMFAIGFENAFMELVPGIWAMAKGSLALLAMRTAYLPSVRFFELPARHAFALPVAGILYGLMSLDSAWQHKRRKRIEWRDVVT